VQDLVFNFESIGRWVQLRFNGGDLQLRIDCDDHQLGICHQSAKNMIWLNDCGKWRREIETDGRLHSETARSAAKDVNCSMHRVAFINGFSRP